jgi:4-amino-4-deoxy-L-arabinose transferase-like glycosyltransferase
MANTMTVTYATNRPLALILLAFIALGLAYSIVNPLHEATDELRHYRYVRYLVVNRALPVQGETGCSEQGHHPPLFYVLGALATAWIDTGRPICYAPPENPFWAYRYWEVGRDNKNQYIHGPDEWFPWRGEALAAHIVRALNVLIGAAVVWLTWAIGRAIWPERPYLALGSAAFVAFNPMFLFMSGAINNDVMAALSGAAVTFACVRLGRDNAGLSARWGVILGVLYGVALLSKFNLAAVAALIAVTVTLVAWREKQWRRWWRVGGLVVALTLLIAGWWFVRNQMLYGEPTGFERVTELWGARNPAESFGTAVSELPYAWTSLWGRFGYGQIPLPQPVYDGLWALTLFASAGLPIPLLRRQQEEARAVAVPLLLLLLNVALFFAVLFNYLLVSPAGPMGRFFFPALPSLALLIFYGLSRWFTLLPPPIIHRLSPLSLAAAANLGMGALALVALAGYLAPAYARPPGFAADTAVPNPVNAQFDTFVRLRGYDWGPATLQAGQPLDLALYWEVTERPPGDYLLFVHLVDEAGTMVAQRDTFPGLGNFPSSQWQPGDRFIETIRLYAPETAYTPAEATLSVGFYAPVEGYRLGITGEDGDGLGDALALGVVSLVPAAGPALAADLPNPLNQNFNNEIRLAGYEYSGRVVSADEPLTVTLYWEALRQKPADYMVEVHLRGGSGQVWETVARADGRPQAGQSPTNTWLPGERIADSHTFNLAGVPPDVYIIHVALIDAVTGQPQNIVAEDGRLIDNHLLLAGVRLQP